MPAGHPSSWRWGLLVLLVAAIGIAACQTAVPGGSAPESASASQAPLSPTESPSTGTEAASPSDDARIAGLIDIGGRSLYMECRGTGAPTILFLHGYGGRARHGYHLFNYADRQMVCTYDRAHMGESDPVDGIQSGADIVDDLSRLLEAAEVPGPYLLVAASHGGLIAELFAGAHPDQVAGMVLIDASLHADGDLDRYFASIGEFDLAEFQAEYEADVEATAWTIHDEAAAALATIPDVPITYLVAIFEGGGMPSEADALWEDGLAELLARSSNGQRTEVDGPHDLPPRPIHAAIDDILQLLEAR